MTIVETIIADSYTEARCDANNVPAWSAITYVDDIYQELLDIKKDVNEDFIKKTYKINLTPYKNEYNLPTDFEKMKQISVKYSYSSNSARANGTTYIIGDKRSNWNKDYICIANHTSWETFEVWTNWNQIYEWYVPCVPRTVDFDFVNDFNKISAAAPVYFYENNTLRIFPRSKETIVEWIYMEYIPTVAVLATSTADADILIERKLLKEWRHWVAMKFTGHMGKDSSKLQSDYEIGKRKCDNFWRWRHFSPIWEELPASLVKYMR